MVQLISLSHRPHGQKTQVSLARSRPERLMPLICPPAETVIPARGTYTVHVTICDKTKFWVALKDDYVLLYDADGRLVDRWEGRPAP